LLVGKLVDQLMQLLFGSHPAIMTDPASARCYSSQHGIRRLAGVP